MKLNDGSNRFELKTSAKVNNDKNRNNQSQVLAANKMIHGQIVAGTQAQTFKIREPGKGKKEASNMEN